MSSERVQHLLQDIQALNPQHFELVCILREAILALPAKISEEVKYGGLLFSSGQPFCGIFSYARHVSLEFGAGAFLPDPYCVLEGSGKYRRHIKLYASADVQSKHVPEYLELALKASRHP
jgi:hypothetical protein